MTNNTESGYNKAQQRKQLRLFISSTFSDMNAERDALTRIFPQISELCNKRGVEFIPLDLRWGITEEDSKEGRVIDACLSEIDEARPFFIGIIGNRYGWTPEVKDLGKTYESIKNKYPWIDDALKEKMSITEMEMQYAALMNQEDSRMNAAFYIRSENMIVDSSFKEKPGSEGERKLNKLKAKISNQKRFKVSSYDNTSELADKVLRDITEFFNKTYPEVQYDSYDKEKENQERILASRSKSLLPLTRYDKEINEWKESQTKRSIFITGHNGRGKSYVLASIVNSLRKEGKKVVYADFSEIGDIDNTTAYISQELLDVMGVRSRKDSEKINNIGCVFALIWGIIKIIFTSSFALFQFAFGNENKALKKINNSYQSTITGVAGNEITANIEKLGKALIKKKDTILYLAIDNLDDLNEEELSLLKLFNGFTQIRMICSASVNTAAHAYMQYMEHVSVMMINNLYENQAFQYVNNYLAQYGKALDSKGEQCKRLIKSGIAGSVQLLTYTLDLMIKFGSFEQIDNYITELSSVKNQTELYNILLKYIISQFSKSEEKLMLKKILLAYTLVEKGLFEKEIIEMFEPKPIQWSIIRPYVHILCTERGNLWKIGSDTCKKIIINNFSDVYTDTLNIIITYFENMLRGLVTHLDKYGQHEYNNYIEDGKKFARQVEVLPELYYETGNIKRLYNWVTYIYADNKISQKQRIRYWKILYEKGYYMHNVIDVDIPPHIKHTNIYYSSIARTISKGEWLKSSKDEKSQLFSRWNVIASLYNCAKDMQWLSVKNVFTATDKKEEEGLKIVGKFQSLMAENKYDEVIALYKGLNVEPELKLFLDIFAIMAYKKNNDMKSAFILSRDNIKRMTELYMQYDENMLMNITEYATLSYSFNSLEDMNIALGLLDIHRDSILDKGLGNVNSLNMLYAYVYIYLGKKDYENTVITVNLLKKCITNLGYDAKAVDWIIKKAEEFK